MDDTYENPEFGENPPPEEPDLPPSGRTPFLSLHDWQPTDFPRTEDWAGDNRSIDAFAEESERRATSSETRIEALENQQGNTGSVVMVNGEAVSSFSVTLSQTDLTSGSSPLATGALHFVYE